MLPRLVIFIVGLAVGSAVNVIADGARHFLAGRSQCDHCGRKLKAWQLIPIASFIILGGRCSSCRKPIAIRYPIVEIACGLIFVMLYKNPSVVFALSALFFTILLLISIIDLKTLTIPDRLLWLALAVAVLFRLLSQGPGLGVAGGAIAGAIIPALVVLPSRGALMGYGDIKLGAVIGTWLGASATVVAFWAAFVIGGVAGIILLLAKRKRLRDEVAFGPYLAAGALIAHLWGSNILHYVTF